MREYLFVQDDVSACSSLRSELGSLCGCNQATLVLREAIVVAAFYLVYRRVNAFCRWLYRFVTTALRQLSSPQGLHLWFHIHRAQPRISRQYLTLHEEPREVYKIPARVSSGYSRVPKVGIVNSPGIPPDRLLEFLGGRATACLHTKYFFSVWSKMWLYSIHYYDSRIGNQV